MRASMFNVSVPVDDQTDTGDVFLMNTFTDAQIVVSRDVVDLIARLETRAPETTDEREAVEQLAEQGFVVADRESELRELRGFFREVRESTDSLNVTVLTTL